MYADGEIKAANIHTAAGKTNHPVSKLYPLEVTSTDYLSPSTQIPFNSDTSLPTRPDVKQPSPHFLFDREKGTRVGNGGEERD
jgi:hypothetical protein